VALAGCGSGHERSAAPTPPACRAAAQNAGEYATKLVRHYTGEIPFPGDLEFFELQDSMVALQHSSCRPAVLGGALQRALPAKRRALLVANLPSAMAQDVRQSLRCAADDGEGCDHAAVAIRAVGAGKTNGTRHPIAP
jgi:hypothetical protein